MPRFLALLLLALSLAAPACGIQRPGEPPYTEAEFTYSTDPTRAILHMKSGNGFERSEMTLFGDGKLVLFEEMHRGTERHSVSLSDAEVQSILRTVVDSGLAEWDPLAFEAQFSEKHNMMVPRRIDSSRTVITIVLDSYKRGDLHLVDVHRKIKPHGGEARLAEMFPDIPEYQGIAFLRKLRREKLKIAKEKK